MMFIRFLEDNPLIDWFIFLVALLTVVPACMAVYRRFYPAPDKERKAARTTRFLGIQMDIAILLIRLLLLFALCSWAWKSFS